MSASARLPLLAIAGLAVGTAAWGPVSGEPVQPLRDFLGDPAYPDDHWTASTPEAEGMDGARLEAAVAAARARNHALHAFLVIRHGKLVLERYGTRDGRQLTPADDHELHSTTKTFTGTLVGLAIADGKLASTQTLVMPFFRGARLENASQAKQTMVVEDLLTMRSGLEYREGADDGLFRAEECSAAAFLSRPLVSPPGTRWNYSSGDSQILAELVRRATGKTPLALADERLFKPLGIGQVRWLGDDGGTSFGGWGLFLRPRDLARFGQLLLARGRWKGAQLVPAEWIDAATRPRVPTPWNGTYGYQCWIPKVGGFQTRGYQGQDMFLFPDRDLIVVFNGALPNEGADAALEALVSEFVLPAVKAAPP